MNDETISQIEAMFMMAATVPKTQDATLVLKDLVAYLELFKINGAADPLVAYKQYRRAVLSRKDSALCRKLYEYYTKRLLEVKEKVITFVETLILLEKLEKEKAEQR